MAASVHFRPVRLYLAVLLVLTVCPLSYADDWPAYQHDDQRSGVTSDKPNWPLTQHWQVVPNQPPHPAWEPPGLEMDRMDFDRAPSPVISNGLVFIASNSDDTIRALDLDSGKEHWRFTASAPIRFAPRIVGNSCFFAADDGWAYCLNAKNGTLIWKKRLAITARQFPGNGRMISRWPCRSGVVAEAGVLYVTAGMWPAEGIMIYALEEKTGREIWCNDTSGSMFMAYPHGGSYAIGGVTPQGYLALGKDQLLVPTGRSLPAVFDRRTGQFLYLQTALYRADGGWRVSVDGESFFSRTHANKGWKTSQRPQPSGPRNGDGLRRYSLKTGEQLADFPNRYFVVARGDRLYLAGDGVVQAQCGDASLWKNRHDRVFSMILAGNALIVGGAETVTAYELDHGKKIWQGQVAGEARNLALANQKLIVADHSGRITCFAAPPAPPIQAAAIPPTTAITPFPPNPKTPELLKLLAASSQTSGGYALVFGNRAETVVTPLLTRTKLHLILAFTQAGKVAKIRQQLLEKTRIYGTRVSVILRQNDAPLPYPDFFANLVILTDDKTASNPTEFYRVLHPGGGLMILLGKTGEQAKKFFQAAAVPSREIRPVGPASLVVRGKLPGALDWDSEVKSDTRLHWPLELAWFGGPGPAKLPNRHAMQLPLAANGRLFIIGTSTLMAIDAYNGTRLWEYPNRDLLWNAAVVEADDDTVYLNFKETCLTLDAATGKIKKRYAKKPGPGVLPWTQLPAYARRPRTLPPIAGSTLRPDPLTGDPAEIAYKRAYGCGSMISSASMHFFRSGTYGMYDFNDDSGLHNFSGARPACSMSMLPALGLLLANDGSGGCTCSYNFQASFALQPAHQRSNEDWAIFYEKPVQGIIRRLALNFGAPGDRRDHNRILWLGMPRPRTGLQISCNLETDEKLGMLRINGDRTEIPADRPWLYSGAVCGIKEIKIDLAPFAYFAALKTPKAPVIDAQLTDACWNGCCPLQTREKDKTLFLRYDDKNLYVAYQRPATIDRRGNVVPWKKQARNRDEAVWNDDACELAFTDARREKVAHIAVSASGAKYDGLWTKPEPFPIYDIPYLDAIKIDGSPDDWGNRGFHVSGLADEKGMMRRAKNLDPAFQIGWNKKGLLLLARVRDNAVVEYPGIASLWRMDSLELFIGTSRNSQNRYHLCVSPGADGRQPKARVFFWDRRANQLPIPLHVEAHGAKTPDGYLIELLLPWTNLNLTPQDNQRLAMQIMVNDIDRIHPSWREWFRVIWHPGGHPTFRAGAMQRLRLARRASPAVTRRRAGKANARGLIRAWPDIQIAPISIPNAQKIVIDGQLNDWQNTGFQQQSMPAQDGTMRPPTDFDPSFRLAWSAQGLLIALDIRDQTIIADPDINHLWRKDSIEIFLRPAYAAKSMYQITLAAPKTDTPAPLRVKLSDGRKNKKPPLKIQALGHRTKTGYQMELLLPWANLRLKPKTGKTIALQIFCNDADDDGPYPGTWFRAAWYPHGHAGWNPLAYHQVVLDSKASPPVTFQRGERVNDQLLRAARPLPWPLPDALAGKTGEDSAWNPAWTVAAQADQKNFTCELAIPLQTLRDAGLQPATLQLDFSHRGPITEAPKYTYMPISRRKMAQAPPRPYTVRLYFAEINAAADAPPRRFSVYLQNREILKNFDISHEAGGPRLPLIREFRHIQATTDLTLRFQSKTPAPTRATAPIINALQIIEE